MNLLSWHSDTVTSCISHVFVFPLVSHRQRQISRHWRTEKHQTHNIAWKAVKETLTSTSCSNDTQQWGGRRKRNPLLEEITKKTPSQFYLFGFHSCVQTVGWFIAVMAAVKLSALNACWLRMHALVALLSGGQHKTFTEDYERLLTEDDLLPLPRAGGGPDLWGAHSLAVFTSERRMPAPCHAHELWISHDIASQPRKEKKNIKRVLTINSLIRII